MEAEPSIPVTAASGLERLASDNNRTDWQQPELLDVILGVVPRPGAKSRRRTINRRTDWVRATPGTTGLITIALMLQNLRNRTAVPK